MPNPPTYADLGPDLFRTLIAPNFRAEMADVVVWRHRWRKIGNWAEAAAHVFIGLSSILAYSAGFFNSRFLAYASACFSTVCIALLRFATYAENESIERNAILGRLTAAAGINDDPAITAATSPSPETDIASITQTTPPVGAAPPPKKGGILPTSQVMPV